MVGEPLQLRGRSLGGAEEEHRVGQATAPDRCHGTPRGPGHGSRDGIESDDQRGRLGGGGREDRSTITGADVDRHPLVAGNDLGELADVHLEEATPDDLLQHARRIRGGVNAFARACSVFASVSVMRGVRVVSDAGAIDDLAARKTLEDVLDRSGQQLFGFARRLGLADDEAAEVVQEALLRLWRTLRAGATIDDPRAWTFRATFRLAMDRHRVRRRWTEFVRGLRGSDADRTGTTLAPDGDELIAVWAEVDRLPARQRQVLYLHYRADLTFEAIGRVLGLEASSARGHAARAIARLRERLGPEA
jgi:RNA polymerase sigma factor (sigma-70 family)